MGLLETHIITSTQEARIAPHSHIEHTEPVLATATPQLRHQHIIGRVGQNCIREIVGIIRYSMYAV